MSDAGKTLEEIREGLAGNGWTETPLPPTAPPVAGLIASFAKPDFGYLALVASGPTGGRAMLAFPELACPEHGCQREAGHSGEHAGRCRSCGGPLQQGACMECRT